MASKNGIIGGIISLVIGGVAYNISQADVAKNFSKDTGMSQTESEQYVNSITEDDLVPFDKVGADYISVGQEYVNASSKVDCSNYTYEWETKSLPCERGKVQLKTFGDRQVALGKAYTILASESATSEDISLVISLIDKLNADYSLEVVGNILDRSVIDESKKSNSYNRALLQTALDSK